MPSSQQSAQMLECIMVTNQNPDALFHFLFENNPIRGNLVHLNHTFSDVLQHQFLPSSIKKALGELMAASALLSASIKMEGALILQIQSKGALKLLVVECSSDLKMRATAKWSSDIADETAFLDLIHGGHCIITLSPSEGEAYQGIVPIEGNNIAAMLENYMLRSQQIETKLWLHCDGESASGLLLQKLPDQPEQDMDAWNRICILAETITVDELQSLSAPSLLTRLFHEEDVRLFAPKPTGFHCSCTRSNVANMLLMLGQSEVESIIAERNEIEVHCDFCNQRYLFDAIDAAALFMADTINPNDSIH